MERESFEDEEVAKALNRGFVAIKVDREERPDIDHIYMSICQAMTGHGGWPLTIIMTPDKMPFFAGTYFPKESRMGYPGIIDLLESLSESWQKDRDKIIKSADHILKNIDLELKQNIEGDLSDKDIEKAYRSFNRSFDSVNGGFGSAPKFPTPHNLSFLLRYWKSTKSNEALYIVEKTLDCMYRGGIYDHIGYGFSRYATDRRWLIPHFEKMLYDNALLAIVYLEAYQATKKEKYAETAKQIFTYVLRDMTSPEGGFYSAEDADSEGVEGKFYIWSKDEVLGILGEKAGNEFCEFFDITEKGNFEGKNIPNLTKNDFLDYSKLPDNIEESKKALFRERAKRIHPYKDDKILTAWNGLMIAALAFGARITDNIDYLHAAEKAVDFIYKKLMRKDGRLLARYRDGEAAYLAYLDDYAFLVWGLIELYEASFKIEYIQKALTLTKDIVKYFYDEEHKGFYIYGSDSEQLIARPKDVYDGAIPSGNSVVTLNFLRLSRITGDTELEKYADNQFSVFGGTVSNYPMGYSYFLMALQFAYERTSEVVIVGSDKDEETDRFIDVMNKNFLPYTVFVFKDVENRHADIEDYIPFTENQDRIGDKTTAYVCENFACKAPVTDVDEFSRLVTM